MKTLWLIYDDTCGLCSQVKAWLQDQPTLIELKFLPIRSEQLNQLFPNLNREELNRAVTVVDDRGGVYRGSHAWIMCLYALKNHRIWAYRFARPTWQPKVEAFCEWLAIRRHALSEQFHLPPENDAAEEGRMK